MFQIKRDKLVCSFPEVHKEAKLTISFQRTLRIPDDGKNYPLPPGLGNFPLRHVDDFSKSVPDSWNRHGGVMLPMYQSEALWVSFSANSVGGLSYPFAVKVGAGKICAVSGKELSNGISKKPQDYLSIPRQPWLDGFCVKKGIIRQFVAMPLGAGYTAEEQLTGEAEFGGLQIIAYPLKADIFDRRLQDHLNSSSRRARRSRRIVPAAAACGDLSLDMGLAPGGTMKQNIEKDPNDLSDWDIESRSRCFVHLCNSMTWSSITGKKPPTTPPTAREYSKKGLPWYEIYEEKSNALPGSKELKGLKSVVEMGEAKGDVPLPENQSVNPGNVTKIVKDGSGW